MNNLIKLSPIVQLFKKNLIKIDLNKHYSNVRYLNLIEDGVKNIQMYKYLDIAPAQLDWNYLLNEDNQKIIKENITNRKGGYVVRSKYLLVSVL
jgi:hypothetical protein